MSKCCGTCKWFSVVTRDGYWHDCERPTRDIPWLSGNNKTYQVASIEGQNCPLYEAKDGEKE